MHYGGLPCDMTSLLKIAKKNKLILIEDAAHALGAKYKNKSIGSISDFTTFSFQAIKHFTTGDGGMLTIKNKSIEDKAKKDLDGLVLIEKENKKVHGKMMCMKLAINIK